MSQLSDILFYSSAATFIIGIISVFIKPIRIKEKKRYYFLTALILLGLAFAFGWTDFVEGFNNCRTE